MSTPRALTRQLLTEIAAVTDRACVSFYLPTHRHGPEAEVDHTQLKQQLKQAEIELAALDLDQRRVGELLAPVRAFADDVHFWRFQAEGLAIFTGSGTSLAVRLDRSPEQTVEVARRFYLAPLVPALQTADRFYILALSLQASRIVEVTPDGTRPVKIPGMPVSIDELGYDQYDTGLQVHSASPGGQARQGALVHGHGSDDDEQVRLQFLRRLVAALPKLSDRQAPIVLATVADHEGLFRQAGGFDALGDRVLPKTVAGSPDRVPDHELAASARGLVSEWESVERERALDRYRELTPRSRAVHEPEAVIAAAAEGRVDTVLLATDQRRWGTFDPESFEVEIHAVREPGDEDLVDLALWMTLNQGGRAVALPADTMPHGAPLAAILRY